MINKIHQLEHHIIGEAKANLYVEWNDGDEVLEVTMDGVVIDHLLISEDPNVQAVIYVANYLISNISPTVH